MKDFILNLVESSIKYEIVKDSNFVANEEWLKKELCSIEDILDVEGSFKYFDDIVKLLSIEVY